MRQYIVGEKVFIRTPGAWGPDIWEVGLVAKITPTGVIKVDVNGREIAFTSSGRQRGDPYRKHLDDKMSFTERSSWIATEKRIKDASKAIQDVTPTPDMRRWWLFDKIQMKAEVDRLQGLLDAARTAVEEI